MRVDLLGGSIGGFVGSKKYPLGSGIEPVRALLGVLGGDGVDVDGRGMSVGERIDGVWYCFAELDRWSGPADVSGGCLVLNTRGR